MHIFLYEWATGGGLVEEPGPLPDSLVREGAAMISALAADLVRIEGCRVTALRDPRVLQLALPGCEVVDVLSKWSHGDEIRAAGGGSGCDDSHRPGVRQHPAAYGAARRGRRRHAAVAVARVHPYRGQQAAHVRGIGRGRRAGAGRACAWNRRNRCRRISHIRPC